MDEAVAAADAHHHPHGAKAGARPVLARPGKHVCDVGGGGGGDVGVSPLLAACLARHPGAKGLVYELAEAARDDALPADLELDPADVDAQEAAAEEAVLLTGAGNGGGGGVSAALMQNLWPGLAKRGTSLSDARRRIKRVSGSFLDHDETVTKLGGGRCDLLLLKVRGGRPRPSRPSNALCNAYPSLTTNLPFPKPHPDQHILHDWSDETSVAILSNLREAMLSAPYGERTPRLVVLEQVGAIVRGLLGLARGPDSRSTRRKPTQTKP